MNASASADGDERRAERLRARPRVAAAATFHAAAAAKNVREPLGRTRARRRRGRRRHHCWQPALREPAPDGVSWTSGAGGSALKSNQALLASSIFTTRAGNGSIYLQKGRRA